jgi:hypothetical protein
VAAYHQMGHDSENLLLEPNLKQFGGAIVSPVNYTPAKVTEQVNMLREKAPHFDVLFDSQLYVPSSQRGKLTMWPYYPKDADTGDTGSLDWWKDVMKPLIESCGLIAPNGVCSPAALPKLFDDGYYTLHNAIASELALQLKGTASRPVQTVLLNLVDLTKPERCFEIASIVSKTKIEDLLLVFQADLAPRRELAEGDQVRGGMLVVGALANAGHKVLVGCTGSDMVLWKAAGAHSCATGKFFNLRRFSKSRFDDDAETGGQNLPYWFEEGLLAFLREPDLVRLRAAGNLSATSLTNPYANDVFAILDANNATPPPEKPGPWVGLGWRQYMHWFADAETRSANGLSVDDMLKAAEAAWMKLEDEGFLMEEVRNNGRWVRPWRRALVEFRKFAA